MVSFPQNPLLHIESEKAQLLLDCEPATLDLDVRRGGYQIKSTRASIEIDNRAFFDSIGLKGIASFAKDYVQAAYSSALKAAAAANDGKTAIENGASIGDLAFMRVTRSIDMVLVGVLPEKPVITCDKAQLDVRYIGDELGFNWDTGGVSTRYVPYSVDIWVEFRDKG